MGCSASSFTFCFWSLCSHSHCLFSQCLQLIMQEICLCCSLWLEGACCMHYIHTPKTWSRKIQFYLVEVNSHCDFVTAEKFPYVSVCHVRAYLIIWAQSIQSTILSLLLSQTSTVVVLALLRYTYLSTTIRYTHASLPSDRCWLKGVRAHTNTQRHRILLLRNQL